MISSVKRHRKVKKDTNLQKASRFGNEEIVPNFEECNFCGMMMLEARLQRIKNNMRGEEGVEMWNDS